MHAQRDPARVTRYYAQPKKGARRAWRAPCVRALLITDPSDGNHGFTASCFVLVKSNPSLAPFADPLNPLRPPNFTDQAHPATPSSPAGQPATGAGAPRARRGDGSANKI